ncbi:phytoene synthase 2, chloroplastic-like [Chenopodium quinoa]|uniref:phytoene synthase 2, chloroplastic-like n=1 Tax=Chenopodium quinoa TaxID=63459 RepID=UPI000B78295E|nr:phytoene synthase 2, chloroplastic-like [Chenopodium quinoa]
MWAKYAKIFYLGTLLMTEERERAIWDLYGSLSLYTLLKLNQSLFSQTKNATDSSNINQALQFNSATDRSKNYVQLPISSAVPAPKAYRCCTRNKPDFVEVIDKQSKGIIPRKQNHVDPILLKEAYKGCQKICAQHATSYYLGSLLLTEERKRAIWALYAWGHRTDELVDGENAHLTGSTVLDSWENRVEDIFDGRPHDILDTALADTVQQFSLDIKPFKDLIKGMRMDTWKTRYENDEELELYCYYVAGTVGLMTVPIIGISPEYVSSAQSIYKAAISMGIGDQLTNILRDVVEDSLLERVYLPQDELREFGMTDKDIFWKNVTEEWREFIKKQIMRARYYYDQAEQGISRLDSASRWPVWASMMLYRANLDKIESNNYDNLTKRARVGRAEKLLTLPLAYAKAMGW